MRRGRTCNKHCNCMTKEGLEPKFPSMSPDYLSSLKRKQRLPSLTCAKINNN